MFGDGHPVSGDTPDEFKVSAPELNFSYIHNRAPIPQYSGSPVPFTQNKLSGTNQNGTYVSLSDTSVPDETPFILDGGKDYVIDETYGNMELGMFGFNYSLSEGFFGLMITVVMIVHITCMELILYQ